MKQPPVIGFFVMEARDDYEQALCLDTSNEFPAGGLVTWRTKPAVAVALFPTRKAAREAIIRTDHYRLAFARLDLPERRFCKIVPVREASR